FNAWPDGKEKTSKSKRSAPPTAKNELHGCSAGRVRLTRPLRTTTAALATVAARAAAPRARAVRPPPAASTAPTPTHNHPSPRREAQIIHARNQRGAHHPERRPRIRW